MCHLTWDLELQWACVSVFSYVLIRFRTENKKKKKPNPIIKVTRQYAPPRSAILTVVQNPISNHGLSLMPQKLMSELIGRLIYSLEIRLKQNAINAT